MAIDPALGKPEIRRYVIGHDCGTVINPHIVKGMTLGGIAHGLGAALLEEFVYNDEGQLITQSFMDYLLPSVARGAGGRDRASLHAVAATPCSARRVPAKAAISARRRRSPARSTTASRRSAFPSTSFRSAFPPIGDAIADAQHGKPKSKPNDHRLPRPSGAAEPAGRDPHAGRKLSVDPPDRGRRQPRLLLCRRQADPAGVEAAERSARRG